MKAALADMNAVCRQALADLLEGEIRFVGNQPQQPVLVRQKLGRRMTVHRRRLDTAGLALALHPFHRRRRAHPKPPRCSTRRTAGFDSLNQAFAKIKSVSPWHDPSQLCLLGENHIRPVGNILKDNTDSICRGTALVSLTYASAIDDPGRFKRSQQVGAHFGLTPKRYQSGEKDVSGRISKTGDRGVRSALYEAAHQGQSASAFISRAIGVSMLAS